VFEDAFLDLAGVVGSARRTEELKDSRLIIRGAIDEILRYYHKRGGDLPDEVSSLHEQLEYLVRPHGIMFRDVALTPGWYTDAIGPYLGRLKETGEIVALIPDRVWGYHFDDSDEVRHHLNTKTEGLLEREAIMFYRPLPLKEMELRDLVRYTYSCISTPFVVRLAIGAAAAALVQMIVPVLTEITYAEVVHAAGAGTVLAMTLFMLTVRLSYVFLSAVQGSLGSMIRTKAVMSTEAAVMSRLMNLPPRFFRRYSAGDLANRVELSGEMVQKVLDLLTSSGLTAALSLIYLIQIFQYARELMLPALVILGITLLHHMASSWEQMRVSKRQMDLTVRESGMTAAIVSSIQKIRLAGAEKRIFARWAALYAKKAAMDYSPPVYLRLNSAISTAISLAGAIALYIAAYKSEISIADYAAFLTAYGLVTGAFDAVGEAALAAAQVQPMVEMVQPILTAVPEMSEPRRIVSRLNGSIELESVSFRYSENMPYILNNLSFKIRPGQYVALVGRSGCGKSTLMRVLLGFEKPEKGSIFYDGRDISSMDLKSLRSKIGVVMQNDALFVGTIFSNIALCAPGLTVDEAWEAARMAGIAEDIAAMPMGMNTVITEGGRGISGGQRQRLAIARAIAQKPSILMFDEATSALDNLTQKQVSDSLAALECTRIVIAHRLSTIRECDRVIVLDEGRIIEDGTYEELIEKNGYFAQMVQRQRL